MFYPNTVQTPRKNGVIIPVNLKKGVEATNLDESWSFQEMIQISIALPSGRSEAFTLPQSSKVGDLRILARKSFQRGFLRLVDADHGMVDPAVSLQSARLEDGDNLTAIVIHPRVAATALAFALFCSGGNRVVTWGHPGYGGDSSEVQDQLKGVQQIQATDNAFAALLADGLVVTWGDPGYGGDSSEVQDQLKGVKQIQSTYRAFAAILADGLVVTWGDSRWWRWQLWSPRSTQGCPAGSSNWPAHLLRSWRMGQLVTWGNPGRGGDSSKVQDQLKGVQQVQATGTRICCDPGGWVACDLGRSRLWRWQLWSPRSAQGCPAGSSNFGRICCHPGGWVGCDLGHSRLWRWQLWSPRSTQGCQADSSNLPRICCDPGGWVGCDLGRFQMMAVTALKSKINSRVSSRFEATGRAFAAILADGSLVTWGIPVLWRWQLWSPRSTQGCPAGSSNLRAHLLRS